MSFVVSRRLLTQSILSLLIAPAALAAQAATTYYVRTDGGDASQCNGRADAPYSGGTAQNCAWKHPYYALPSSGTARIAGGDTLMIGSGEYMIGYGAPGMAGTCASGDRSACSLGKVPSGTASAPTRILGNSAKPPKLWGAERTNSVLNLVGSNNVEVGYLEITDKSNCISGHTTASAACNKTSAPYGNWARAGIQASASSNVWLHDLNIHGLAAYAMNAGGLSNWTMERVKMNANGWAGWDGNVGTSSSSNSGQMVLRQVEIAWNGCAEDWQTGAKTNCWAQKAGGYGDGMGTYYTGGQWLIEDSEVHHNTSDGVDLLYLDGAAGTTLTVRRLHAYANAGNQLKTNGNATIENSVLNGYCSYFAGKDFMQAGDQCRANGNALSISMVDGNVVNVRHNTIISEGQGAIMNTGGTASAKLTIQNNAIVGKPYYLAPSALSIGHIVYNSTATVSYSGNLFWNVKNSQCPSGSVCQDPKLTNTSLTTFDAQPLAGSPVIDKVPVVGGVTTDFVLAPRPSGAQADIGAYEVQTAPVPVCTAAAPTVTMTGSSAAVAAGSTVSYTVNVRNNDSAQCGNTSFSLARTIPTGWTGALSAASIALAPGASGSATLQVTSPASATQGNYGIGTGVSSSVGGTHTASASATYAVSAPAPVCTRAAPTVSLTGSTAAVAAGSTVSYTVNVRNNDSAECASTSFSLARTVPTGWTGTLSAGSIALAPGASGTATLQVISPASAAQGNYGIGSGVSSAAGGTHTASASSTYSVAAPAGLTETLSTDKTSYVRGSTVYMTSRVLKAGKAVSGASVKFTALKPDGITKLVSTVTTDANGYARWSFASGTGPSSIGTYKLSALATSGTSTTTANTTFQVN